MHQLSQFISNPSTEHQQAASKILRYIKGAPGKGIFFPSNNIIQLKGFSDSNWAGCIDTRQSITCYSIYLGSSLISWKSKKQATVSKSSSEAGYRALATATSKIQWLTFLLQDLQLADIYTKGLPLAAFKFMVSMLGMINIHSPA
ncbi:secreted RxLR effector protein 161-like [Vigna angularis]|uniref:secreted RxLR effector protein 161-like n=1 Tax=Phaseolus angularis TaxID=3914 RepID=UPI0022B33AEC|nr:secreted RxLR effector protein 161-like [Vigna angularis]